MLMQMNTHDWQILRTAVRSPEPPTGRQLRIVPNRRTKDGSFLADLVAAGLLRVVTPDADPFAATYALTPLGEHAAEYGEYECDLDALRARVRRKAVAS